MYSARSKCMKLFLCRLYCWTESKFMIRSHFTAGVPGLSVSDVNFNFCSQSQIFSFFLQVWCPAVFASLGHCVQLKFGHQDMLSGKMFKKCATLAQTSDFFSLSAQCTQLYDSTQSSATALCRNCLRILTTDNAELGGCENLTSGLCFTCKSN